MVAYLTLCHRFRLHGSPHDQPASNASADRACTTIWLRLP